MANKPLGEATSVASLLKSNSLIVEVGGAIRRISVEKFTEAINEGQTQLLHSVAWGIPIKDELQSSPAWGMAGNTAAYNAYKAQTGRYLMDANGRAAKLHPNNSGGFADGTALDETKGSVVVIAPRLYYLYQVDAETNVPYLWMSQQPISKHCIGTADNGTKIVIGAYQGSFASGKLVSRSDVDFETGGKTISSYWAAAQAFGTNWGIADYDIMRWIGMMCLCETGGNANIQAGLGQGVGGAAGLDWTAFLASATLRKTGATKSLGDSTGSVAISDADAKEDSCHVSVLGIEDWWNCQWNFIQGLFFGSSANEGQDGTEVFVYTGNRMPSTSELASHPEGLYRELTRPTSSGYVSKMLKGEYFDLIAAALEGSSASYWCDYFWGNNTGQVCLVGGSAGHGAGSGPFYVCSSFGFAASSSNCGARPAFYGPVTIVGGGSL